MGPPVPVLGLGECHGVLDATEDLDADSISGSNTTYEFAGVREDSPEMLYTRTYSCACLTCRESSRDAKAVNAEYSACLCRNTVGRWQQQTIHSSANVVKQRQAQRLDTKVFAPLIKPDSLYAAYASARERGQRDYWLLRTKSEAKQAKGPIKVVGGTTIRTNAWYVEAEWYSSTSDDQGRKSYKLLAGEVVSVPVVSFVQELMTEYHVKVGDGRHGLVWSHEGRTDGQSILSPESHLALVQHNYSNVQ